MRYALLRTCLFMVGASLLSPATIAGADTFTTWNWNSGADWSAWEAQLADVNGDGRADLYLHAKPGTGAQDYFAFSNGAGFQWAWSSGYDWNAFDAVLADVNGDGKADLYLHGRPGTGAQDYLGLSTGSGFIYWNWTSGVAWNMYEAQLADMNGDGRADLYLHGRPGTGAHDYAGLSSGTAFNYIWTSAADWNIYDARLGDVNGDGKADLYLHGRPDTGAHDYIGISTGSAFAYAWTSGLAWNSYDVRLADVNGDRKADLYLHGRTGSGAFDYVGLSTGSGFTYWNWNSGAAWNLWDARLADVNGDGKADLYMHGSTGRFDYLGMSQFGQSAARAHIVIPAYFYPSQPSSSWDQAIGDAPLPAGTKRTLIMNPASGPGSAVNADYVAALRKVRAAGTGFRVIGYVHTSYGQRPSDTVKAEIALYRTWYGVDGIFLDEVSADAALIAPYYQPLVTYATSLMPGGDVMLNPGTYPARAYMDIQVPSGSALSVVSFEGTYQSYLGANVPSWAAQYPAQRFVHLVYGTGAQQRATALELAKSRNAGQVYVTDDSLPNPWDTLPSYWTTLRE
jgi:hypothetical protein